MTAQDSLSGITKMLTARMQHIETFTRKVADYMHLAKDIITGINPGEYKILVADLDTLHTMPVEVLAIDWKVDNIIHLAVDCYQRLTTLDACARRAMQVMENETYAKLIIYNMSSTYVTNVYQMRNDAAAAHEKYLSVSVSDDEEIFKVILAAIPAVDDMYMYVVNNEHIINKFTMKMISQIIVKGSNEKRRRAELIIENQKDIVLSASRADTRKFAGVQGAIGRYNLLPVTKSMPVAQLFASIGAPYDPKVPLEDNFTALAKQIGVLTLNKATPSAVEFNLSGLINADFVAENNLKTNPLAGLNKKIIERFSTATLLPRGGPPDIVRQYGKGDKWYVFESINGELWRLMGVSGEKIVPADMIAGLLRGVTTRPHKYNSLQVGTILSKCFDSRAGAILSSYSELQVSTQSSESIRAQILDKLTKNFEAKLTRSFKTAAEVKSAAVDHAAISETLLDVLTHSTGGHGKGAAEYLITYIAKFDGIIYDFIKKLERQWGAVTLSNRIFTEYPVQELGAMLVDVFRATTSAAINELDQTRVWTDYDISLKEFFLEKAHIIV